MYIQAVYNIVSALFGMSRAALCLPVLCLPVKTAACLSVEVSPSSQPLPPAEWHTCSIVWSPCVIACRLTNGVEKVALNTVNYPCGVITCLLGSLWSPVRLVPSRINEYICHYFKLCLLFAFLTYGLLIPFICSDLLSLHRRVT